MQNVSFCFHSTLVPSISVKPLPSTMWYTDEVVSLTASDEAPAFNRSAEAPSRKLTVTEVSVVLPMWEIASA